MESEAVAADVGALKTADSGYLTRKLADVAQNVIVNLVDCGTIHAVTKSAIYKGEEALEFHLNPEKPATVERGLWLEQA